MAEPGIAVNGVWKRFHKGALHDSLRDLIPAIAKRIAGRGPKRSELEEGDFWALRDVSFNVKPGEALGIIGPNGAGKSTMLKVLNRILRPNRGNIEIRGRMGALIEVAAGFHGDLTGGENVYLQGAIMGMKRVDIKQRFDRIVEFSGIGDFIDTPVKRYSSGMNARLGFSIAAHLDPDVLLIDEVLAVGDMEFQSRAFGKMQEVIASGIPVVLVTHQLDKVTTVCTKGILLKHGQVAFRGSATDCVDAYTGARGIAEGEIEIHPGIRVAKPEVEPTGALESGEYVTVRVKVEMPDDLPRERLSVGLQISKGRSGPLLYDIGTEGVGAHLPPQPSFEVVFRVQPNLPTGDIRMRAVVWDARLKAQVAEGSVVYLPVVAARTFNGTVQMNGTVDVVA